MNPQWLRLAFLFDKTMRVPPVWGANLGHAIRELVPAGQVRELDIF